MASFRVTDSEPAPLDDNQLQPPLQGMMQKVWTVTSDKQIKTLNLHVPGVVFIDHSPDLASSPVISGQAQTETKANECALNQVSAMEDKIVAQIVVTSDSVGLLESLEVVPLEVDKEDQGFQFRVKNEDAELKGSILTQVFVSDKHTVKEFNGGTAEYVIGESVLVESDPTADVELWAFQSGSLLVSSAQGFTLRSLKATITGDGTLQLQAPLINVQEEVLLMAVWGASTIAVSAATIAAKALNFMTAKQCDVVVHSENLTAKTLCSCVGFSSSINFVGDGHVKKQSATIMKNGDVNTCGIIADEASAFVGWSGRILLSALNELESASPFFGTIEYANIASPPTVLRDAGFHWWKDKKTPGIIAKPAAPDDARLTAKPYEFRESPARQPVAIHHRVEKSRDNAPQIVKPDANSWTSRYSKLGWVTGAVTVGAIVVIATRRRAARLA